MKIATNNWYSLKNGEKFINIKFSSQTKGYTARFEDVEIDEDFVYLIYYNGNIKFHIKDLKIN